MDKETIIKIKNILLIAIIISLLTGLFSFYVIKPIYQTYTTLMIGKPTKSDDGIDYSDVLLFKELVTTFVEIAKSKNVANDVIKNLKLDIDYEELKKKVNINIINETGIIKITVKDKIPAEAVNIAMEYSKVIKEHIYNILKVDNIQIIDIAEYPQKPIVPKPLLYMFISFVISIMLLTFLIIYFDSFLLTKDINDDEIMNLEPTSDSIKVNIYKNKNALIITTEDFSTNILNLIKRLSKLNRKILLIDFDFNNKKISRYFKLNNKKGLINIINENINFKMCLNNSGIKNVKIISLGIGELKNNDVDLNIILEKILLEYDIVFLISFKDKLNYKFIESSSINFPSTKNLEEIYEDIITNLFIEIPNEI